MPSIVRAIVSFFTVIMENIAAKTTTFNGTAFDTKDYEGNARITVQTGAVSGTSPTLDGKIQSSATSGGTYADVSGANFTQVTAANGVASIDIDLDNCNRFIRYVGTIAGTSPSFTIGVLFTALKKY